MLKYFKADLHIHTCLSPCGDLTMSPKRIIEKAIKKGMDIIGITDHNSGENVNAALKYAEDKNLTVIPGMEINSKEETHILAFFNNSNHLLNIQKLIYEKLPDEENREDYYGKQIIANELDEVEGYNKKLLISATSLNLGEIVDKIHALKGLAIASHVDRESYSIIGQLGFIPPDIDFDALEVSPNTSISEAEEKFPEIRNYPVIKSSDAHYPEDIGKNMTEFYIEHPSIEEFIKAFKKKEGRNFSVKE